MNFDYPAPKSGIEFNKYWDKYVHNITSRDNFKEEHLDQLSVLCQLYVEFDTIEEEIRKDGMTYESFGRNGRQIKAHPLLSQLNVVRNQIAAYCRMLGLVLNKDTLLKESDDEKEWK